MVLIAYRAGPFWEERKFSPPLLCIFIAAATSDQGLCFAPYSRKPAPPATDADEREEEEEELSEGVPDELTVEVFEADFSAGLVGRGGEA